MVLVDMEKVSNSFKVRFLQQVQAQSPEEKIKVDRHESTLALVYSRRDGYPDECPMQKKARVFTPNFWALHQALPESVLGTLGRIVHSGTFEHSKVDFDNGGSAKAGQVTGAERSSGTLLLRKPHSRDRRPVARALHHVEKLAAALFGVSTECVEPLQIVRYTEGQKYMYHHDSIDAPGFKEVERRGTDGETWTEWVDGEGARFPTEFPPASTSSSSSSSGRLGTQGPGRMTGSGKKGQNKSIEKVKPSMQDIKGKPIRIGTLLIYLNSLPAGWGAETDLCWATTKDTKAGELVRPQRNCGVAWSNIDIEGRPAEGAIHQGRELSAEAPQGTVKYAVNVWVSDTEVGERTDSAARRMEDIAEIDATSASSFERLNKVASAHCFPWSLRGGRGEAEIKGGGAMSAEEGTEDGEAGQGDCEVCLLCGVFEGGKPGEENKNDLVMCETVGCLAGVHLECYQPALKSSHLLATDYESLALEKEKCPQLEGMEGQQRGKGRPLDVLAWHCPLCVPERKGVMEGVQLLPAQVREAVFGLQGAESGGAQSSVSRKVTASSSGSSSSSSSSSSEVPADTSPHAAHEKKQEAHQVSLETGEARGKKREHLSTAGGEGERGGPTTEKEKKKKGESLEQITR
uniref:Prolyl 4-hydroxylase alpha subunit domain-containing protein n=1 Tax=Chromera velia CCMP2878 TaxID=1169474 RepID=A0A0G4G8L4_9ALVE|eukprot:Cvel_20731.t1-p1 / transcript=Cvel_20731.t1 / gene=Cvel_20731 / organism=Chromera_velia_CCMP2878 / gene_product=hypothetical protein / transcript_product=hypothetical protein / location=Cvel_scaffold1887:30880-35971(+) / protein_length=630 / sequence_SO=supercontig / SO=protein_coding / is_pseudo=false